MRTKTVNIYTFAELSEEGKKQAIKKLSDINVDSDWWDSTYEDAERIGLKLQYFDLDRNNHATGEFNLSACVVAQNIFNEHGETCETYKTATSFMEDWQPIFNNYMDETHPDYESQESEQKMLELEDCFLRQLLGDYAIILQKESEYLQSEEAIIDTIEANEYEFDENGNLE